jgi:hypothetical protein
VQDHADLEIVVAQDRTYPRTDPVWSEQRVRTSVETLLEVKRLSKQWRYLMRNTHLRSRLRS